MDILTESFQVDFNTKDDFIKKINSTSGCCICGENHETDQCTIFDNLVQVKDSEVPLRAVLTLPKNLKIESLADGTKTIVASDFFQKGSQFGPFEAKQLYALNPFANFPIKVFSDDDNILPDCYLDTTNEEHCNWMCYVVPAHNLEEQNLICYQFKQDIFFSAIKDINPGDQLKVWYSPYYAAKMGVNVFVPKEEKSMVVDYLKDSEKIQKVAEKLPASKLGAEQKQNWVCKMCGFVEHNVVLYAKHLQDHYIKILANSFTCDICNEGFSSEKCLIKHKKLIHTVFTEVKNEEIKSEELLGEDACMPLPIDQYIGDGLTDSDPSSLLMLEPLNLNENQSLALYNDLNDVDTLREILCDDNTKASKTAQEKSIADFRLDLVENETNSKVYTCDICQKQFQKLQYLCLHLKKHTGEYTCLQCLMVFTRKENYQKHPCFISEEKVFNCQYCSKVFLEKKYLVRHIARHDKKYKCGACGKQYSSQKEREQHNCPSVPLSEKKVYPCQICNKNFYRDLYLRRHVKNFHENKAAVSNNFEMKEKEVICEVCAERFANFSSLKQHMATHNDPKFECTFCSKKFYRKDVFENHLKTHGSPELPCKTCGKKLKNKKSLDLHMLQHSGDKRYSCSVCDKKFMQKMNLIRHEATHGIQHNSNGSVENVSTENKCTICDKTFVSKFALMTHIKTHDEPDKAHKCDSCEKSFTKKHLLKKHFVHTHLDKVYSCPYCFRIFKHRNSIRRHLNQSHKSLESEWNDPAVISTYFVDAKSLMNKDSTTTQETFIENMETNSFDANNLVSNQMDTSNLTPLESNHLTNLDTTNLTSLDSKNLTLNSSNLTSFDSNHLTSLNTNHNHLTSLDSNNLTSLDSNNLTSLDSTNLTSLDSNNLASLDSTNLTSLDSNHLDPTSLESNILDPTSIESTSLDSNQYIESNSLNLQSEFIDQSLLTNNLVENTDQQITLGKNAFILEDGTIVQPQDEGNVMIYVLDQRFSNIFNNVKIDNGKSFIELQSKKS